MGSQGSVSDEPRGLLFHAMLALELWRRRHLFAKAIKLGLAMGRESYDRQREALRFDGPTERERVERELRRAGVLDFEAARQRKAGR